MLLSRIYVYIIYFASSIIVDHEKTWLWATGETGSQSLSLIYVNTLPRIQPHRNTASSLSRCQCQGCGIQVLCPILKLKTRWLYAWHGWWPPLSPWQFWCRSLEGCFYLHFAAATFSKSAVVPGPRAMDKRGADDKKEDGGFLALELQRSCLSLFFWFDAWCFFDFQLKLSVCTSNHQRPVAKIKIRPTSSRASTDKSRASASSDPFPEPDVQESGAKVTIRQSDSTLGLQLHPRKLQQMYWFYYFQVVLFPLIWVCVSWHYWTLTPWPGVRFHDEEVDEHYVEIYRSLGLLTAIVYLFLCL